MALYNKAMENGSDSHTPKRGWFTTKEAASYAHIHIVTLYRYIKKSRRKPRFHRVGKQYRFPIEEFKEWADGPSK